MPLEDGTNDLITEFSSETTTEVFENAVWPMLCNQSWQGEFAGANKVIIQDPTYNTAPVGRTRGADFGASKEVSTEQIELTVTCLLYTSPSPRDS